MRARSFANEVVHLSPKAFDLLTLLVERRPRALSKAELHDHIWPAAFVSDGSLPRLVSEIRVSRPGATTETEEKDEGR